MAHPLDDTDRTILRTLRRHPRASITEIARRAGFARGTVYGRLERLGLSIERSVGRSILVKYLDRWALG